MSHRVINYVIINLAMNTIKSLMFPVSQLLHKVNNYCQQKYDILIQ